MLIEVSRKLLLVILAAFYLTTVQSQNYIKELKNKIQKIEAHDDFSSKDTVYIKNIIELSTHMRYDNWDSVLLLSKKALKLSIPIRYNYGEAHSYILIGDYYSDKGDFKKAMNYYEKALKLVKKGKDCKLLVDVLNAIAISCTYNHEPARALKLHMECIEICYENGLLNRLSMPFTNIGLLYSTVLKDYAKGIYFLNEAKKFDEEYNDIYYFNTTLSNLAYAYMENGELDKAMAHLKPSTAYFENIEEHEFMLLNYTIEVGVLLKQKKFEEALVLLNKLKKLHEHMQDDKSLVTFYEYMFKVHLNFNDLAGAKEYVDKGYVLSKKIHFIDGIKNSLKNLYVLYKEKNDFDNAYKYHEQFQNLTDSILKVENKNNLNALQVKLEFDEQKRKLIEENEIAIAKHKRYILLALIVLCIIFCVVFMIRKNTNTQDQYDVQLRLEKEKLEKNELVLKEANRTKDKLFSIIGHDLRSPIAAFQGLLALLKENEISEDEFVGFLPKLESDLDRISFMLNNLLSWGRAQMNSNVTKTEVFKVKGLVTENMDLLSEIAGNKSITIVNEIPSDVCIWADVNQIDIVFRNLMSNAIKFTEDYGVIVIGAIEKEDTWLFYVRDTGIGMDLETQEKIFMQNTRHSTYGTHNEKGTGLGLNLCKEMIQKNNGTIWLESVLGIGSCFYFELPKETKKYKNVG